MSTAMETILITPDASTDCTASNREGDWDGYLFEIADQRGGAVLLKDDAERLTYKRQCALAYLGKRAQLYGGVCSKTVPRILTAQTVAKLEETNKAKRYARYPWLETLLKLMAEIELIQDQSAGSSNVFSLVPHLKQPTMPAASLTGPEAIMPLK